VHGSSKRVRCMDVRSERADSWADRWGRTPGQRDTSVYAITDEGEVPSSSETAALTAVKLVRSGSKQVSPMDMRSGWADNGRIDGSGLRAT